MTDNTEAQALLGEKELRELVDKAENSLAATIRRVLRLEAQTCARAAQGDPAMAEANAKATAALGYLYLAKGMGTSAAMTAPGFEPRFGGK